MKKIFENFLFKGLMTLIVNVIGVLMLISAAYISFNHSIESTSLFEFTVFALTVFSLCFAGFYCIDKNYYKLNDNEIAILSVAYALDYLQVKHGCEKQGPWTFNEKNKMLVTIRNFIDNVEITEDEIEKI